MHESSELFHIDNVPSKVRFSQSIAVLYVFEDNEAVIKMIIKGRSPTMRHVSRTHRVSLDWLFDTKHQVEISGTSRNKQWFWHDFFLVQVVVFRLLATFRSQAIDGGVNRPLSHIAYTDTNTLSARHTWCHTLTRGSRLRLCLPSKTFLHLVICLTRHVVWSAQHAFLVVLYTVLIHFTNQEPAPIHAALEVTVLRNPILSQVMSPIWFATKWLAIRRLSTSSTRSSLNKRVLTLPKIRSCTLLKKVKFRKLRISSSCHSTSHSCLRPRIQWKALPRLKAQTWMTNKFVFCWLHHGTCRTEKQVRNDFKFITLEEKVWCQVRLKVWTFSAQGNLWHVSHTRLFWKRATCWCSQS